MLGRKRANALLMSSIILCVGLAIALAVLWTRHTDPSSILDLALTDPALRQEVVSELVAMSYGIFDSHPDADVGRVFQTNIRRQSPQMGLVETNRWGLRERDFAMPKQSLTVRVILLGDSYIYGNSVTMDDRVGVFLERFLRDRSNRADLKIECLHVGIPSWNIVSESAFVRRQIQDFQPDLVIQVVVPNDLDDLEGVRGFGALASFTPQHRQHGSSLVSRTFAQHRGFFHRNSFLLDGFDYESRSRYGQARKAIQKLAAVVEESGGHYVLVINWMKKLPVGHRELAAGLAENQIALLPFSLFQNEDLKISKKDGHWNPAGHERVARFLYSFIQQNDLLPQLSLRSWDVANQIFESMTEDALAQMAEYAPVARPNLSELDFRELDIEEASQIYGGVLGMYVSPYMSVVLARENGKFLQIDGKYLDSPSMAGSTVEVYVEERKLATLSVIPGRPFQIEAALPADLVERPVLNVRLVTDDYIYMGEDLRTTMSLGIIRIAIVQKGIPGR